MKEGGCGEFRAHRKPPPPLEVLPEAPSDHPLGAQPSGSPEA